MLQKDRLHKYEYDDLSRA